MTQLGQLVFTGLSGLTLTDDEKKFIEKEDVGGVILFSKNFESPAQLAELVNKCDTSGGSICCPLINSLQHSPDLMS